MSKEFYRLRDGSVEHVRAFMNGAQLDFEHRQGVRDGHFGLGRSTIRSFHGFERPAETYYDWAHRTFNRHGFVQSIIDLRRYSDFKALHWELHHLLVDFWIHFQTKPLSFAQANKLVDLFFKHLAMSSGNEPEQFAKKIALFAHVPLDKHSLLAVKKNFYGTVVCSDPSMGNIDDWDTYYSIQEQIRYLMQLVGYPCLYFDHYAYDQRSYLS